ncbi:MAG: hypothetical protein HFH02_11060 [Dorea sp.]|nr:hypothetical protein [Dorea sp.]
MAHQKNKNLYVVKDGNHMRGAPYQKNGLQETEDEIRQHKTKFQKRAAAGMIIAAVIGIAAFLYLYMQTYTGVRTADTYKVGNASDNSYQEFAGGVLKYSRDGIAYLNDRGEEQWNLPYQIKNPFLDVNSQSAAVADKGGNNILVFQKDGLKGEIKTTLPIEKIAVSEQGIVAAVLKNEYAPRIICYDTAGNVLVEHKTSMTGVGYPVDIAISPDGEVMQAVYLAVNGGEMTSKVCYYNFGEAGAEKIDHQVTEKEYKGSVIGSGFFINEGVSASVGDNCLTVFKGREEPKEAATIQIKGEIQSVFHSSKYIGLLLKTEGNSRYELCLYNTSGKKVLSREFGGTYKSAKISGGQIILYDGKKCSIYTRFGVHRFEGEMNNNILEIFPAFGINKYIVMDANGMEDIRLVK